jgi:predicted ATPase
MLRSIRVKRFKSFDDSGVIALAPLTVLFGPNAAGKSTFIDALLLTSRLASERTLADAFGGPIRGRAIEAFLFGDAGLAGLLEQEKATLAVDVTLEAREQRLRYRSEVALHPRSGELKIGDEYLAKRKKTGEPSGKASIERVEDALHVRRKGKAARPYKMDLGSYTALSDRRFSGSGYEAIERCRADLGSFRAYYLDPRVAMRSAQSPQEVSDMGRWASTWRPTLRLKSHQGGKRFAAVVRTLRTLIPSIEALRVELNTQRGEIELTVFQEGVPCSSRVVSEGTLRVLALACIAANPFEGSLVAFEEPENGVHPRRIELIARLLLEMAKQGRQVVVTTHSPVFVGEVIRLVRGQHEGSNVALYDVSRVGAASRLRPFEPEGPLFTDAALRRALADPTDEGILEAALLRGILDG